MAHIIEIIELVSSFLLIVAIMMQNRGTGLGETFGGEGNIYTTRRSVEKILFNATIVLAVVFFASAITLLYIS